MDLRGLKGNQIRIDVTHQMSHFAQLFKIISMHTCTPVSRSHCLVKRKPQVWLLMGTVRFFFLLSWVTLEQYLQHCSSCKEEAILPIKEGQQVNRIYSLNVLANLF